MNIVKLYNIKLVHRNPLHSCTLRMKTGFPGDASVKEPTSQCRRHERYRFNPRGWEDPLEEGTGIHSSTLAKENSIDRRPWWAAIQWITKSWIQLKLLRTHATMKIRKRKNNLIYHCNQKKCLGINLPK